MTPVFRCVIHPLWRPPLRALAATGSRWSPASACARSSLVRDLSRLGHDVDTVIEEGLTGQRDHEIWETVQQTQRFLITQDLDFSNVRRYLPGVKQAGLLIVRLRQPGR